MVYIDLDDVIANTSDLVIRLAKTLFDKRVCKDDLLYFDPAKSLTLDEDQYVYYMDHFHSDDNLLSIPINMDFSILDSYFHSAGIEYSVVTGRPLSSKSATSKWLNKNNIICNGLYFVDKYERYPDANMLSMNDLRKYGFVFGVEDSFESAFQLAGLLDIYFYIYRQPWNVAYEKNITDVRIKYFDAFASLLKLIS